MTPQQLIEFLLEKAKELNPEKPIVFGQSFERAEPILPTDFEIVDGQLFLDTYEGM